MIRWALVAFVVAIIAAVLDWTARTPEPMLGLIALGVGLFAIITTIVSFIEHDTSLVPPALAHHRAHAPTARR